MAYRAYKSIDESNLFLSSITFDIFKTADEETLKLLGLPESELKLILKKLSQEGLIRRTDSDLTYNDTRRCWSPLEV